jgi:5-methylphenazine-1-carboxylate 1-monooxygenase
MNERNVLIAGAGIGGLTAALSLHAAGIDTRVIESARTIAPLGVGINLQPQAVTALTELGLGDRLAAMAVPTAEHVYVDRLGRTLMSEPRGIAAGHPAPQYSVHRGELQSMLLTVVRERLGADAVRAGTRLADFTQTDRTVRVTTLDRASGREHTESAGELIGAEGLHSVVRARLHPGHSGLHWSGMRMWRGLVAAEPFLTGRTMLLVNGGDTRMVIYPVTEATAADPTVLVNWVAIAKVSEPEPIPDDAGVDRAGRAQDVLPLVADWSLGSLDVRALIAATPDILEYPMVDRDPLGHWGLGRVTLLGDAAHPMYPVGANGGSQAILDARVLAGELAVADPVEALARYEQRRRPATSSVVLANREMDRRERAGDALTHVTESYRATIDDAASA